MRTVGVAAAAVLVMTFYLWHEPQYRKLLLVAGRRFVPGEGQPYFAAFLIRVLRIRTLWKRKKAGLVLLFSSACDDRTVCGHCSLCAGFLAAASGKLSGTAQEFLPYCSEVRFGRHYIANRQ